jgi:hypothetical protein
MIRSGEGQNPPEAEGSVQDTPGPTSLESSRGGRSRSRSGSSSGKRDRDRSRDRSRSRTPGSGRSRRARGQLKTEVVDDPSGSHGGADRQVSAPKDLVVISYFSRSLRGPRRNLRDVRHTCDA